MNKDILQANARPRAILFDWDNTLVDSWPTILDALNATFEAYDMAPWTLDQARIRVRKSMRDSYPELFGDRWEEAGQVFYRHFSAIHLAMLRVDAARAQLRQARAGPVLTTAELMRKARCLTGSAP